MGINVQGVEGGNSASSLLCTLIETLVELKCQLWRKSVEKRVKILTRDSFSIRNRADSWTETTYGNKCGCLLTAVRGGVLAVAATGSSPWRCLSTKPLQCPRKALEQGLLDRNTTVLLSENTSPCLASPGH